MELNGNNVKDVQFGISAEVYLNSTVCWAEKVKKQLCKAAKYRIYSFKMK